MKSVVCVVVCILVAVAGTAFASPSRDAGVIGTAQACRYSVAYTAPPSCPHLSALERRLGPSYRVERGTMASCDDCVRGISIELTSAPASYRMALAGLESTVVDRAECEDLVELAVYAIEASDLPTPECSQATGRVGLSATPFINLANADPMVLTSIRGTLPVGLWQLTPSGALLVPTTADNRAGANGVGALHFSGVGAGLEMCHAVHSQVQLCAAGQWRHLYAKPALGNWSTRAADIWTLGAGVAWSLPLSGALRFELEPLLMAVLGKQSLTDATTRVQLYSHAGIEALLRVGFSWEFGSSGTPIRTEALRAAATPVSPSPRAASSNHSRWF